MKKILLVTILLVGAAVINLTAQAIPSSKLAWDQAAPDLVSAQGYTYKYYPDGSLAGITLLSVTCTGTTSPFQCEVSYPAFTPGNHNLILSASNIAGETKSDPFVFVFVVTPSKPANLHIK